MITCCGGCAHRGSAAPARPFGEPRAVCRNPDSTLYDTFVDRDADGCILWTRPQDEVSLAQLQQTARELRAEIRQLRRELGIL